MPLLNGSPLSGTPNPGSPSFDKMTGKFFGVFLCCKGMARNGPHGGLCF